eukprot:TRINITY_DN7042_c0_g2_i2.p1 TRINITY_DN7042_c0_g2~~TRINITY_DN7042_c0_g2_i2.p1  ORF type:complete len:212 (+),score=71.34 TRINITY_DN7042_c0_g2_i2:59-637(+)
MSTEGKSCPVCQKTTNLRKCGGCGLVAYCSIEHQRQHWAQHKNSCKQKHKKPEARSGDDPVVTWEDQQKINRFGVLNQRMMELKDEVKQKKEEITNLEDAITEIELLMDEDACRIRIGEVYMASSNENAQEYTERVLATTKEELTALENEFDSISTEMSNLKDLLYAKFGTSINLDTDEEKEAKLAAQGTSR